MLKELQEDFERWWVTATFEQKISLAVTMAILLQMLVMPIVALLARSKSNDG